MGREERGGEAPPTGCTYTNKYTGEEGGEGQIEPLLGWALSKWEKLQRRETVQSMEDAAYSAYPASASSPFVSRTQLPAALL